MASAVTAAYTYLGIAIVAEVVATSALKASEGFTRPMPSLITAVGYALAFYCLSHTLKSIPTGVAYALWSGVGIVLISAVGGLWLGQRPDATTLMVLVLVSAGVRCLKLFTHNS